MKNKSLLVRFLEYYKPHKKMFAADMSASFFISAIGMLYPILTRSMLNDYIPNKKYDLIIYAGIAILVFYIIRMFLRYFVQYYGHMIGVRMQAAMRRDMFKHLEKLPYKYFDEHETGKIMSRLTNDLMDVSELAHHGPENLLICGLTIIASFIYLCTINITLTLIIFSCVPVLFFVSLYYRTKMKAAFKERRANTAVINAAIESSITGIRVTKAYTNAEKELEKFERGNADFVTSCKKAYNAMGKFHSSTSFITDVFNVIILIAGGAFLYAGTIDFADYSTFIVSVNLFISPVTTLIGFMEQYQNGITGFSRFIEIIDEKPEEDAPDAIKLTNPIGEVEFKNVKFNYNADNKNVLDNISFKVEKGKKVALVGESGGGKTTICHLIPRFYEINGGQILIDGTDVSKITLDSLRRSIGIVQQDVFLFNGSIKDNILYGRLDASDDEVVEAAKRANIHDYVMSLPDRYETQIGERGVKLSGGQKQRLSIARVFLKNPAILILDEATSALDNTTEILIQQALDELCKGRTTIVVAHRLSTVRNADQIIVIESGQIVEMGTHDELMKKDGIYKVLYSQQFRDEDLAKILS